MLLSELKDIAHAHGVRGGRTKGECIGTLIRLGKVPTEKQTRCMVDLRLKAYEQGHKTDITAEDLVSKSTASAWIERVQGECSTRRGKRS